jgi:hypothetical protein
MAQTEPWFRFYTETPDDPKLKRAARMAGCKKNVTLATWTAMLALCKRSPISGVLLIAKDVPAADYDIDEAAGNDDPELTHKVIEAFISLDMVSISDNAYVINHWDERQFKSDNSTQRWREWNEKKKANVDPTLEDDQAQRLSNGPEEEAETDADTEKEKKEEEGASASPQYFMDIQAESIFIRATGMPTIPGKAEDKQAAIDAIRSIRQRMKNDNEAVVYLQPFFREWKARKYSSCNNAWLTDWAVSGEIPEPKKPAAVPIVRTKKIYDAHGNFEEVPL